MYKYELHMHTRLSSACGKADGKDYVRLFKEMGYDGIFITDHFYHGNTSIDRSLDWPNFVEEYMKSYRYTKAYGDAIGLKVFFGLEECFEGDEILVYGIDEEFLLAHPEMTNWTREQWYENVKAYGGCVIQAHPFRDAYYLDKVHLNLDYVDAVEAVNTRNNPHCNCLAKAYCQKFSLLEVCGSDIHALEHLDDSLHPICHIEYEKPLESTYDFAQRIVNRDGPKIVYDNSQVPVELPFKNKLPSEIIQFGKIRELDNHEIASWCKEANMEMEI